jgi:signal transduction histidine kinase/ActR/RegA family two-component response regulator
MNAFGSISLKRKQTLIIMLTSCVALLMACGGFTIYDVAKFQGTMKQRLAILAEVLGANSTAALEYNDPKVAAEVLSALRAEPHITAGWLFKDGEVFARYERRGVRQLPPALSVLQEGQRFKKNSLVLFQPLKSQQEIVGAICLESDLEPMWVELQQYAYIAASVLLLASLVAFLMSAWLQQVVSGPILQLVRATGIVSLKKDYTVRVPNTSRDELGQLIDAFNDMLGQIQERDTAAQQAQENLEKRVLERTAELRQQITRVNLLNQIARAVVEGQDLAAIFSVLMRALENDFPIDFGGVYLFDPHRNSLVVASHAAQSEAFAASLRERPGQPVVLEPDQMAALLRGESRHWPDKTSPAGPAARLVAAGLQSGATLPLLVEGKLLGIVIVARQAPGGFSTDELQFLNVVGEQVALAARQAQLHSELRKAYDELRTTQQAALQQERLRALGQMASGIAHDINNALVPVLLGADMMLNGAMNLTPQGRRLMERIKKASQDIATTVARLKEFYRQRHQEEFLAEIDLRSLADEVIDLTRPVWRDIPQQRGVVVNVQTELERGLPRLSGNQSEIRQALMNLILNAVDAMPKGGTITLRARQFAKTGGGSANGEPTCVCFEVGDTGVGMDDETRRRCLEPFFTTKGSRGTGLGLAMAYGVMERHNGHIEIDSAIGRGTIMRLVFPLASASVPAKSTPKVSTSPLPFLRILCIDDEPLVLEVVSRTLGQLGHQVIASESGVAGLDALRRSLEEQRPFDAIITDLGMPEMDGRAVAQVAKRISPKTPVILLTGWGIFMKSTVEKPEGVDFILSKPPSVADLTEGLRSVTSGSPNGIATLN